MCDPYSLAMAGVALATSVTQSVVEHNAQQQAYDANKQAAEKAYQDQSKALTMRQMEEQLASGQTIQQVVRQARQQQAEVSVSAGEVGVSGASVDALMAMVDRDSSAALVDNESNSQMVQSQLEREKDAAKSNMNSRINSAAAPSWGLLGLKIGSSVVNAGAQVASKAPPTNVRGGSYPGIKAKMKPGQVAPRSRLRLPSAMGDYNYDPNKGVV